MAAHRARGTLLPCACAAAATLAGLLGPSSALAQPAPEISAGAGAARVEAGQPALPETEGLFQDIITAALKSDDTIYEAPAIVSVLSGDRLRDLGFRNLTEAMATIPGFLPYQWAYGIGSIPVVRGILGGALVLRDGLDVYDTGAGFTLMCENIPPEIVKRIEVISGPGGVLWGANSFVGVVSIASKTADDLQGIEASAGYGGGAGRPGSVKTYVMGGTRLLGGRLKMLGHVSYETWHHAEFPVPFRFLGGASSTEGIAPAMLSGPFITSTARSHALVVSGNAELGPFYLYFSGVPYSEVYRPFSLTAAYGPGGLGEDTLDCGNPANQAACSLRVDPRQVGRHVKFRAGEHYGQLGYRDKFPALRLHLDARVFYLYVQKLFDQYVLAPPSSLIPDGLSLQQDYGSHRVGLFLDARTQLNRRLQLLTGGELFYDVLPRSRTYWYTGTDTLQKMPFRCALPEPGGPCSAEECGSCPLVNHDDSNRIVGGAFVDLRAQMARTIKLEGGARVQAYGGKRGMSPVPVFSGAAVWTFVPNWNLKVNYAGGYRVPPLGKTDSMFCTTCWGGNPDLRPERSHSVQGELNARLARDVGALKQISARLDYSYTWVSDFIQVIRGRYTNTSHRGISSAELLVDLTLKGDHWVTLAYTFLDQYDAELGRIRSLPNQWLSFHGKVNLWRKWLYLTSSLFIAGAAEDPNLHPAAEAGSVFLGGTEAGVPKAEPLYVAKWSDRIFDRISPVALWNVGLSLHLRKYSLRLAFDAQNILDGRGYYPEGYMDLSVGYEVAPNPRPGFSYLLSATYSH